MLGKPDRKRCLICDKSFVPSRSDAIACGGACRQKAYRIRRKIGHAALRLIMSSNVGSRPRRLVITRNARAGSRLAPPRGGWGNAGVFGPGWAMTFRTSESKRNPVTASLSDALYRWPGSIQDFPEHERRYSLSPRAAAGILRRAKRDRAKLPPVVKVTLRRIAGWPVDPPMLEAALRQAEGFGGEPAVFALDGRGHASFNISPTLVTSRQGGIADPARARRLTPMEYERLQGFLKWWTKFGAVHNLNAARYRMLGNAVCPPIVYWISLRILAYEGPSPVPTYGSLFTGIGGFDHGLDVAGWTCAWQVEIDPACIAVLKQFWPNVPRFGDVKQVGVNNLPPVDMIVGGFPCQDLSVAGKRRGLAGKRSGLFFEFMRIVNELHPTWVLIENVPGLLSLNGGRDMGAVLGALGNLGYRGIYRVLDARYFGVAQRRRRVFIAGRHGTGPVPAFVLLDALDSVLLDALDSSAAVMRAEEW